MEAVKAYEQSVPVPSRKPFSGAIASIRQNQRIQEKVIPEISQWVAAHN